VISPILVELQGWKIAVTSKGMKGFVPGNYLKFYEINAPDLPAAALQHAVSTGLRQGKRFLLITCVWKRVSSIGTVF